MLLWQAESLMDDIAGKLGVDRNVVTKAVRWWHESRSLPAPDGRTRRKTLQTKTRQRRAAG